MHHNQRTAASISTPSIWGTTPFGHPHRQKEIKKGERVEEGPCWQSKQVRPGQPHEIWSMGYCGRQREKEMEREKGRQIVARSCCDCPQNGTINVAYPFSQIVAQQKDARLQLSNTVNKCQCPFPASPPFPSPLPSLLPCPFIDNIMTFRIIFQIVKKTLKYFFSKNQNWNCFVSWWCCRDWIPFGLWLTAGLRRTYWSFNYDFLLVFRA